MIRLISKPNNTVYSFVGSCKIFFAVKNNYQELILNVKVNHRIRFINDFKSKSPFELMFVEFLITLYEGSSLPKRIVLSNPDHVLNLFV